MEIQRISFDMNSFNMASPYERKRIALMGSHIERLLFSYGLDQLRIPNCNFIHLLIHNKKLNSNLILPSGKGYDKRVNLGITLDVDVLFKTSPQDQVTILLKEVSDILRKFLEFNNLPTELLDETNQKIHSNNLFLKGQKMAHYKSSEINAYLMEKCLYDAYIYQLQVETSTASQTYQLCTISPIYIPVEHPRENHENYVRFPSIEGWINENTFKITCGHKEYNFYSDKMKLEVIEHEELKSKFINWESVH